MRYSWTNRPVWILRLLFVGLPAGCIWLIVSTAWEGVKTDTVFSSDNVTTYVIFGLCFLVVAVAGVYGWRATAPVTVSVDDVGVTVTHVGIARMLEWRHMASLSYEFLNSRAGASFQVTAKHGFEPKWPKGFMDGAYRKSSLFVPLGWWRDEQVAQMLSTAQQYGAAHHVRFLALSPIPEKWRMGDLASPGGRVAEVKDLEVW